MTERPSNVCVICQAPLTQLFLRDAIVCSSTVCQWTLSVMPANRRCVTCTRPLGDAQVASGLCGRAACHDAWATTGALGEARAALRETMERATAHRAESAAAQGVAPDEVESYRLAVIPRNPHDSTPLPAERRTLFEAHLRRTITQARDLLAADAARDATDPSGASVVPDSTEPDAPPETDGVSAERRAAQNSLLGRGCATCRGSCCTNGGNHAFVHADRIRQYLHRHPTRDDDTIVADYLSHVGELTVDGSCLFHQETGCSLPREMRGTVCNSYHCTGLQGLINRFHDGDPVRAYFVHKEGTTLSGGSFVQIAVRPTANRDGVRRAC